MSQTRGTNLVRKISPAGDVTTLAGLVVGRAAHFFSPLGIACDRFGNTYVADSGNETIRKISMASSSPWVQRGSPMDAGRTDGPGSSAVFNQPEGIAIADDGTVFVAEMVNHVIRVARRARPGDIATIDARTGAVNVPRHLDALDSSASSWQWSIVRRPAGSVAELSSPLQVEGGTPSPLHPARRDGPRP